MKNLIIKINSAEERELDFFLNEQDSLSFEYTEHREMEHTKTITVLELYRVLYSSEMSAVQHIANNELTKKYNDLVNAHDLQTKLIIDVEKKLIETKDELDTVKSAIRIVRK